MAERPVNIVSNPPKPATHWHGWPGPLCSCSAVASESDQ